MNKHNKLLFTALLIATVLIFATAYMEKQSRSVLISELPHGYEVYNLRCVEDMRESVVIFTDGKKGTEISWISNEIEVEGIVILPTGEKVTFLGFDSEGNPLFSVVE